MFNIALYQPDIPQNTAAIIRLCSCFGATLEIIEPCGFNLEDKRMKKVAIKTDNLLWKKIVSEIKKKSAYGTSAGQWSARKAQAAVKAYKKAGGEYISYDKSATSLHKWTEQKWKTKSGKKRWIFQLF